MERKDYYDPKNNIMGDKAICDSIATVLFCIKRNVCGKLNRKKLKSNDDNIFLRRRVVGERGLEVRREGGREGEREGGREEGKGQEVRRGEKRSREWGKEGGK